MAVTYYQANRVVDFLFGSTSMIPSGTYYIGLSTTPIQLNGTGQTEPAGGGYTRLPVVNNKTSFTVANNGVLTNNIQLEFPESTTNWGTITHVFLSDSVTGGNILYYDTLTTPRTVQNQTVLIFAPNSIRVTLN